MSRSPKTHRKPLRHDEESTTRLGYSGSLGVSWAFIMNKIKEGNLTSIKKGTRHRIAVTEVERFRQWYLHDLVEFSADDALKDLFGGDQ